MNNPESHKDMTRASDRILEAVGLSAQEERAYLLLLEHPGLTPAELAGLLEQSESLTAVCLNELEAHGLVARSPTGGRGYVPAPPEVGVQALVERRQEELRQAERSISWLVRRVREALVRHGRKGEGVEIATGEEALHSRMDQLQRTAGEEVLGFVTAECPYSPEHRTFERCRERDVPVRMIFDRPALESATMREVARTQAASGVEVRVAAALPGTLTLFDRRTALFPQLDDVRGVLLASAAPLIETLLMYFKLTWCQAAPFGAVVTTNGRGFRPEHEELIALLAAGFKDEAIARRLGLSPRTMDRRIRDLLDGLKAETRFQAGWLAAHRLLGRRS